MQVAPFLQRRLSGSEQTEEIAVELATVKGADVIVSASV